MSCRCCAPRPVQRPHFAPCRPLSPPPAPEDLKSHRMRSLALPPRASSWACRTPRAPPPLSPLPSTSPLRQCSLAILRNFSNKEDVGRPARGRPRSRVSSCAFPPFVCSLRSTPSSISLSAPIMAHSIHHSTLILPAIASLVGAVVWTTHLWRDEKTRRHRSLPPVSSRPSPALSRPRARTPLGLTSQLIYQT